MKRRRIIRIKGVMYSQYLALRASISNMVQEIIHTHIKVQGGKYWAEIEVAY